MELSRTVVTLGQALKHRSSNNGARKFRHRQPSMRASKSSFEGPRCFEDASSKPKSLRPTRPKRSSLDPNSTQTPFRTKSVTPTPNLFTSLMKDHRPRKRVPATPQHVLDNLDNLTLQQQVAPVEDDTLPPQAALKRIRHNLHTEGYVWIPGQQFRSLLMELGATKSDLELMESGHVHAQVARDPQPAMHFRQSAVHRMVLGSNPDGTRSEPRMAGCPGVTQLPKGEIASGTATAAFDRSATRYWPLPPPAYASSSVSLALARLYSVVHPATHHPLANVNHLSDTVINDQILLRVNKDPGVQAECTPEGVHQDGSELTSVTLIDRYNVAGGGESRLWSLAQPAGNYDSPAFGQLSASPKFDTPSGFSWAHCLLDRPLIHPWDTIIFNDRKVKHEVRPFRPASESHSHRDVIVNLVRKPLRDGSDQMKDNNGNTVSLN